MMGFLKRAPMAGRVAADRVDPVSRRLLREVFLGIFRGLLGTPSRE